MGIQINQERFTMETIATILIVEDDTDILELETFHLIKEGYKIIGRSCTKEVENILNKETIDLILMDRTLPRVEGSEFIGYLRDKGITTPVMFISAKDKAQEIEEGFLQGADDYLTKPFNIKELLLRVRAILRRTNNIESSRVVARDIIMDSNTRKTYIDKKEVSLTKLEFELLRFFIQNQNRVLERNHLLKEIWKDQIETQKRTINVTINRLKKKIDPLESKNYIMAIRGIGYKFG